MQSLSGFVDCKEGIATFFLPEKKILASFRAGVLASLASLLACVVSFPSKT